MNSTTTMHALKAATAEHHARAEAAMPPLAEIATRDGYLQAVRLMHGFHAVWEPVIWSTAGLSTLGLNRRQRSKLPLLERDLAALDAAPLDTGDRHAPDLDLGGALGALYVLEGATLGGRVILRHLPDDLDVDETTGAAYYGGYGEQTGEMWKAFGAVVNRYAAESGEADSIVEGAVACFSAFEHWVAENSVYESPAKKAVLR